MGRISGKIQDDSKLMSEFPSPIIFEIEIPKYKYLRENESVSQ
jgi:hypothetical protein